MDFEEPQAFAVKVFGAGKVAESSRGLLITMVAA